MNSMMSTSVLATAVIIFEEAVRYTLGKCVTWVGCVKAVRKHAWAVKVFFHQELLTLLLVDTMITLLQLSQP